jgi:hypothetical protein
MTVYLTQQVRGGLQIRTLVRHAPWARPTASSDRPGGLASKETPVSNTEQRLVANGEGQYVGRYRETCRGGCGGGGPVDLGTTTQAGGTGIVIAVSGVGAGDMISSLVAGTDFGTVLIWAIVVGAFLKFVLTEGIGRWYMASGETILKGWHMLGRGATWYFLVCLFIVTFVFGAAVTSTAALGVDAMFPNMLPVWAWAALHAILGFVIVGVGRYDLFERSMKFIAAIRFGAIILLAILLTPS